MAHTYEELKAMTVAALREVAAGIEHEAVQGYTQLHKEELIPKICEALGIESHEHHEVVGIDKGAIKRRIKALKTTRDEALASGDKTAYKKTLREIHKLKHELRRATV